MTEPQKITKAFLRHLNKQVAKQVLQLVDVAYQQGRLDESKDCIKDLTRYGRKLGTENDKFMVNRCIGLIDKRHAGEGDARG